MPWLLNEDAAMKYMLQGLVVHDVTDGCPKVSGVKQHAYATGRQVGVRYRSPEDEVAKYKPPSILVEFPEISMAYDRMHQSAPITLPYAPEGYDTWWDTSTDPAGYDPDTSPYRVPEHPVAYNIDYQITVYTRIKRDHLMPILAAMEQWDKIGRMSTLKIPQDGTYRTITRLGGPHIDWIPSDENEKKLFTATYKIRVPTEIFMQVTDLRSGKYPNVNEIIVHGDYTAGNTNVLKADLVNYYNEDSLSANEVKEAFGILSVGSNTGTQVGWDTQQLYHQ